MVPQPVASYAATFNRNFVREIVGSADAQERFERLFEKASRHQRSYLTDALIAGEEAAMFSADPQWCKDTLRAANAFAAVAKRETHDLVTLENCIPRQVRLYADVQQSVFPYIPRVSRLANYKPDFGDYKRRLGFLIFG